MTCNPEFSSLFSKCIAKQTRGPDRLHFATPLLPVLWLLLCAPAAAPPPLLAEFRIPRSTACVISKAASSHLLNFVQSTGLSPWAVISCPHQQGQWNDYAAIVEWHSWSILSTWSTLHEVPIFPQQAALSMQEQGQPEACSLLFEIWGNSPGIQTLLIQGQSKATTKLDIFTVSICCSGRKIACDARVIWCRNLKWPWIPLSKGRDRAWAYYMKEKGCRRKYFRNKEKPSPHPRCLSLRSIFFSSS